MKPTLKQDQKIQTSKDKYQMPFKIDKVMPLRSQQYYKLGNWTSFQKLKFAFFLQYHEKKLQTLKKRRSLKTFKYMAEFIKTKSPKQCRSHHQKVGKTYKNILLFVDTMKKQYGQQDYWRYHKLYYQELKNLYNQMIKLFKLTQIQQRKEDNQIIEIENKQRQQVDQKKKQNDQNMIPTGTSYKQYAKEDKIKLQQENQLDQNQYIKYQMLLQENIQKEKIISQCNFFFLNWMKSTLKLQYLNNQIAQKKMLINYFTNHPS